MASNEEKIQQAIQLKEQGNALYKQQHYKKARLKYNTIFAYVNGLPGSESGQMAQYATYLGQIPITQEQKDECLNLRLTAYSNLALCELKLENPAKALSYCDKAIAIDPNHVKAHFRKGLAHRKLKEYDQAVAELTIAQELDPTHSAIRQEAARTKQLLQRKNAKSDEKLATNLAKALARQL